MKYYCNLCGKIKTSHYHFKQPVSASKVKFAATELWYGNNTFGTFSFVPTVTLNTKRSKYIPHVLPPAAFKPENADEKYSAGK